MAEEDNSHGEGESVTSTSQFEASQERDEIEEARHISKKENKLIRVWRVVAAFVLFAVAATVTGTTFHFLTKAQEEKFLEAFDQFSRTVGDAAIQHQANLRSAYKSLSDTMTATAMEANATWPFYTMPYFEVEASHARHQSNSESFSIGYVVKHEALSEWLEFSEANHEHWVKEGHMIQQGNLDRLIDETNFRRYLHSNPFLNATRDSYLPTWSYSPPPSSYGFINFDGSNVPVFEALEAASLQLPDETLVSAVLPVYLAPGLAYTIEEHEAMHSTLRDSKTSHPHANYVHPVYERLQDPNSDTVAYVAGVVALDANLQDLLPPGIHLTAVITNSCGQAVTYDIIGDEAVFRGDGDRHDREYDDNVFFANLFEGQYSHPNYETIPGHCIYYMYIYPNEALRNVYQNSTPALFATMVACAFVLVAIVCAVYDRMVGRRNESLVTAAARSNSVVTSLFPGRYRDEMIQQMKTGATKDRETIGRDGDTQSKPLADLFLEGSVAYADIGGFSAWSSVREPHQVFTFLESAFGEFDKIAKRRAIYKVETVRDCYVAVAGVPNPRKDHAVAICRFANEIVTAMRTVSKSLVVSLGPDTGDLAIRVGVHSGPITAGVLRGERARFQLFGDTVNETARIEHTGSSGKVHLSSSTAAQLIQAGKGAWVEQRFDKVIGKGRVEMDTYWLTLGTRHTTMAPSTPLVREPSMSKLSPTKRRSSKDNVRKYSVSEHNDSKLTFSMDDDFDERTASLIDWNTEVLSRLLCAVIASRSNHRMSVTSLLMRSMPFTGAELGVKSASFLDEVVEIIELPEFNQRMANTRQKPESVVLPRNVSQQLRHFVASIASMYRDNPFHSFEHASHVMMAMNKLMSRIVAPKTNALEEPVVEEEESSRDPGTRRKAVEMAATMHDHTYGITSDPLTLFACALSGLIHDVDHEGVPNAQLVKEKSEVAGLYDDRSPAEQHSLELSWILLMEDEYTALRNAIFASEDEKKRFRQLLVNSVLATDIADKELKVLRNGRWDKAFKTAHGPDGMEFTESERDAVNRKATIVIEHLIQASDVAHTMQHWHVYRRWNENLFRECYKAYREGRAETDPSINWYQGEIGFFDFYVIPLAKKLKECGVFGKSSGEFLSYASSNRNEWAQRGEEATKEMLDKAEKEY